MGCCSPNYQKMVEEEENKINEKNNKQVPLWGKLVSVLIVAGALLIYFL